MVTTGVNTHILQAASQMLMRLPYNEVASIINHFQYCLENNTWDDNAKNERTVVKGFQVNNGDESEEEGEEIYEPDEE